MNNNDNNHATSNELELMEWKPSQEEEADGMIETESDSESCYDDLDSSWDDLDSCYDDLEYASDDEIVQHGDAQKIDLGNLRNMPYRRPYIYEIREFARDPGELKRTAG